MRRKRATVLAVVILYACATLQFVRFYIVSTPQYLDLPAYLAGRERLPFQERVLPMLLIKPLAVLVGALHSAPHTKGAFTPERAPLYILALISMVVAGIYTQKLYNAASESRSLSVVVYPIFLFTMLWTYSIHTEANFAYPYDLPAVAFFSAGLYFLYTRRFVPLAVVIALGTFNRETTLFLVPLYVIDQASTGETVSFPAWRSYFHWKGVAWWRGALLLALWLAVKLPLAYHYRHNSHAENYVRLRENIGRLKPRLWPALLNVCGYLLPLLLIFQRYLRPLRFRSYLWILPFWFAVMFYTGVIVETRIYGELCPFVAVALTLVLEQRMHPIPNLAHSKRRVSTLHQFTTSGM